MIVDIFESPAVLFGKVPGIAESVLGVLALIAAVLFALSLHEAAHGWTALKCGDPTAKKLGRVTLNPIKHIDPIGTLMLLVAGFGWASPVPVNPVNFKKPKRDTVLVSSAGIIMNIAAAFIAAGILGALSLLGNANGAFFTNSSNNYWYLLFYLFFLFVNYFIVINVGLALFNLLPFFPLDGYRILAAFTGEQNKFMVFMRNYSLYIILALLIMGWVMYSPLDWYIVSAGNGIIWLFEKFWGLLGL